MIDLLVSALEKDTRDEERTIGLRRLVELCTQERDDAIDRYYEHTRAHYEIAMTSGGRQP